MLKKKQSSIQRTDVLHTIILTILRTTHITTRRTIMTPLPMILHTIHMIPRSARLQLAFMPPLRFSTTYLLDTKSWTLAPTSKS
jgi:hypothetical protein